MSRREYNLWRIVPSILRHDFQHNKEVAKLSNFQKGVVTNDNMCIWNSIALQAESMYFWSSWSTNCLVYFSFFLVDQRKICPVSDLFCSLSRIFCPVFSGVHVLLVSLFGIPIVRSMSHFFGRPIFFLVRIPNFFLVTKLFLWSTKKMRN